MSITYHNPENLSDWGQSDGWRLKTEGEPHPEDAEYFAGGTWWRSVRCTNNVTYRTKKPLPASPLIAQLDAEIKAKQELKEIALAVEAGAEWEAFVDREWSKGSGTFEYYMENHFPVRLKPKPVTRDWNKPGDVPWECWLRAKGADDYRVKVIGVNPSGVTALGGLLKPFEPAFESLTWEELAVREYSTGGEWKPCTTEEAK